MMYCNLRASLLVWVTLVFALAQGPIVRLLTATATAVENNCNCKANEICDGGKCQPLACFDLEWSPHVNETDIDCGGEICSRRCNLARKCKDGDDCVSHVCSKLRHMCLPSECGDQELSGNETAVDCGGPQCDPCEAGQDCERNEDCRSRLCEVYSRFICLASDCEGKTCGSDPFCPRCSVGSACEHDGQCESDHCENGICYLADCERRFLKKISCSAVYFHVN